jgi:CRP-like cAMP-binding protein
LAQKLLVFDTGLGHMTLGESIRRHKLTKGLCEEEITALAKLATKVEFDEGTLILKEGQLSEHFYLLLAGSVAVELRTPQFNICVQALGPGEAFGWSAVLDHHETLFQIDHHETLFQIRAREPICAVRISGSALTELCRNRSQLGTELLLRTLCLVAGRVKATERRLAEMCGVRLASAAD